MTETILGIDVGPEFSAYACIKLCGIGVHGWIPNRDLLTKLREGFADFHHVALESPQPQDRPLGRLLRDTILWTGRYIEAMDNRGSAYQEVDERDVALWLCGRRDSNNSALLQSLKDRFGDKMQKPCGNCTDGRVPGAKPGRTKLCPQCHGERFVVVPGQLAGLNEHERSAIAAAVLVSEKEKRKAS